MVPDGLASVSTFRTKAPEEEETFDSGNRGLYLREL